LRSKAAAKKHRTARRTEEKETQRWLDTMQQTRQVASANAPKTRLWFQLDREGDAWPIAMDADKDAHWFTIRGNHNRRVRLPDRSVTPCVRLLRRSESRITTRWW